MPQKAQPGPCTDRRLKNSQCLRLVQIHGSSAELCQVGSPACRCLVSSIGTFRSQIPSFVSPLSLPLCRSCSKCAPLSLYVVHRLVNTTNKPGLQQLMANFDQEAACVILARWAIFKVRTMYKVMSVIPCSHILASDCKC